MHKIRLSFTISPLLFRVSSAVEQWTVNPLVVSSNLTPGVFFSFSSESCGIMFKIFENILGSLFTHDKSQSAEHIENETVDNSATIKGDHNQIIAGNENNSGNIAGRDINNVHIQTSTTPSWIEKHETMKKVIHHFKIFFSLADSINDKSRRIMNPFSDCKRRMTREFDIKEIAILEPYHQKEIHKMHDQLMKMKHASECTSELQDTFKKRLTEISDHYSA